MPDASRLHRGVKLAGRAAVYTHRDVRKLVAQFSAAKIHKAETIPVYAIDRSFIDALAAAVERFHHGFFVVALARKRGLDHRPQFFDR